MNVKNSEHEDGADGHTLNTGNGAVETRTGRSGAPRTPRAENLGECCQTRTLTLPSTSWELARGRAAGSKAYDEERRLMREGSSGHSVGNLDGVSRRRGHGGERTSLAFAVGVGRGRIDATKGLDLSGS